jgi:DNA-binding protein H-NS
MPRTASLKAIERQIQELEAKAEALKQRRKPGLKQLKAVLVKYRLNRSDVDLVLNGHGAHASKLAGRKLKPKYRNPANKSETWERPRPSAKVVDHRHEGDWQKARGLCNLSTAPLATGKTHIRSASSRPLQSAAQPRPATTCA